MVIKNYSKNVEWAAAHYNQNSPTQKNEETSTPMQNIININTDSAKHLSIEILKIEILRLVEILNFIIRSIDLKLG
jgi:hypothetical protein